MKFRKSTFEIDIRGPKRPKNPNASDSNLQTFQKTKNYWNRLAEPKVRFSQTLPLSGGSPPIVCFWHYRTSDHNSYVSKTGKNITQLQKLTKLSLKNRGVGIKLLHTVYFPTLIDTRSSVFFFTHNSEVG